MATKNDITGDSLISRGASKAYLDNYDLIFRRKGNPEKEKENGSKDEQAESRRKDQKANPSESAS